MGAFALPMLGKIAVEAQHLVSFRISAALEPSVQDSPSSYLFPMFRALAVHVVDPEKDWPVLSATGAAWVTVRAVVREHIEFQG